MDCIHCFIAFNLAFVFMNIKMFSSQTSYFIPTFVPFSVQIVLTPFITSFIFPVPDESFPAVEIFSDSLAAGIISHPNKK